MTWCLPLGPTSQTQAPAQASIYLPDSRNGAVSKFGLLAKMGMPHQALVLTVGSCVCSSLEAEPTLPVGQAPLHRRDRLHEALTFPRTNAGDSRFLAAAYATAPRRACPALSMFLAALWSRCRLVPQWGQVCHRTERPL
jgi:hypothetical protein